MNEVEKRKRGRPKKGGTRHNRIQCKMTDDELRMLRYLCETKDKTVTDVVLDSIKMSFNLEKYREK